MLRKTNGSEPAARATMTAMVHPAIEAVGALLRPTDDGDLATLRSFFDDPGVHEQWGGRPLTDHEILAKYTGKRAPAVQCFIVEEDRNPIGFMQYHQSDDRGGGLDLVLHPVVRGRGLGRAVVLAMVDYLQSARGWQLITVDPEASNPRGVDFWERVGFEPARLVEDEPGRPPYWLMKWPHEASGR